MSLFTKHNYRAKNNVYLFNYENKLIYYFKIFYFLTYKFKSYSGESDGNFVKRLGI
jgi:hypothetical protein